jgi:hypothetical protein
MHNISTTVLLRLLLLFVLVHDQHQRPAHALPPMLLEHQDKRPTMHAETIASGNNKQVKLIPYRLLRGLAISQDLSQLCRWLW